MPVIKNVMLKKLNKKYLILAMVFVAIHALFIIYINSIPPTINSTTSPQTLEIKYDLFLVITLIAPLLIPNSIGIPVFANVPFLAIPNVFGIIVLVIFWFLIYWLVISIFFKIVLKINKVMRKKA